MMMKKKETKRFCKWRKKRRREKGGKDKKEMLKEYTEVEESAREREERGTISFQNVQRWTRGECRC